MDSSLAEPFDRNDMELGPVTHWPTVYAAAGVAGVVVVGLAAVAVLAARQPPAPPEVAAPVAAVVPAPPARPRGMAVKPAAPVPAVPVVVPTPEPQPTVVVARPAPPPDLPIPTAVTPIFRPSVVVAGAEPIPILPPPAAAPPTPSSFPTHPRALGYEADLVSSLRSQARDVDLNAEAGASANLLAQVVKVEASQADLARPHRKRVEDADPLRDLIAGRPDLTGLPLRGHSECLASSQAAELLGSMSGQWRLAQARLFRSRGVKTMPVYADEEAAAERDQKLVKYLAAMDKWSKEDCVPGMTQMLQADTPAVRLQLTKMLAAIRGPKASLGLAQQALFDLSPEIREGAVLALRERPAKEWRAALLRGFRYPWAPVADHAAYALTTLGDRGAVEDLEAMTNLSDPAAPTRNEKNQWVKPELVRVNHLRNCLLCHAPSSSEEDPVRGFIPTPGEAIPVTYYSSPEGHFVRADITYLKQDFSVLEAVADPGYWPEIQRFDYMIRLRELTDAEFADWKGAVGTLGRSYPQRAALLFTLSKLTEPSGARPIDKVGLGP